MPILLGFPCSIMSRVLSMSNEKLHAMIVAICAARTYMTTCENTSSKNMAIHYASNHPDPCAGADGDDDGDADAGGNGDADLDDGRNCWVGCNEVSDMRSIFFGAGGAAAGFGLPTLTNPEPRDMASSPPPLPK